MSLIKYIVSSHSGDNKTIERKSRSKSRDKSADKQEAVTVMSSAIEKIQNVAYNVLSPPNTPSKLLSSVSQSKSSASSVSSGPRRKLRRSSGGNRRSSGNSIGSGLGGDPPLKPLTLEHLRSLAQDRSSIGAADMRKAMADQRRVHKFRTTTDRGSNYSSSNSQEQQNNSLAAARLEKTEKRKQKKEKNRFANFEIGF